MYKVTVVGILLISPVEIPENTGILIYLKAFKPFYEISKIVIAVYGVCNLNNYNIPFQK